MTPASAPAGNAATSGDGVTTASDVAGPACKLVPASGKGSAGGMIDDPVVTAAGNNPLLTKLVVAVGAAGLGDPLNAQPASTVFAPADDAVKAPGDAALAKDPAQQTPILKYHVVGKRYDLEGLLAARTVPTLDATGGNLKIDGSAAAPHCEWCPDSLLECPDQERDRFRDRQGAHPWDEQVLITSRAALFPGNQFRGRARLCAAPRSMS
jgi:hypothetical protein